jgi:hypothetical protein
MLKVYNGLKGLLTGKNIDEIKEELSNIIKDIEKGEYLIVDIPFNETSFLNVVQDEDGETIVTNFEEAKELITDCQNGKILKL